MKKSQLGFTLIEMLVVIAIIGLLSTSVAVALQTSRAKARNAVRKESIAEVRTALELYFLENQQYPNEGDVGKKDKETDLSNLASFVVPKFLYSIPVDPSNGENNYEYIWGNDGADYGILIPFSNDGGNDCKIMTTGGDDKWFHKTSICTY